MQKFEDLVLLIPNALELTTCSEIIERFEQDSRKAPGVTTNGPQKDVKNSIDLSISHLDEWADIDKILFDSTNNSLELYSDHVAFQNTIYWSAELKDNGYNVKRYNPDGYFNWHSDRHGSEGWARAVAYIWYLNDVEEGGETEFTFGLKIKPKTGQLLMFPACWTFPHRGLPPVNGKKYIITTFIYAKDTSPYS